MTVRESSVIEKSGTSAKASRRTTAFKFRVHGLQVNPGCNRGMCRNSRFFFTIYKCTSPYSSYASGQAKQTHIFLSKELCYIRPKEGSSKARATATATGFLCSCHSPPATRHAQNLIVEQMMHRLGGLRSSRFTKGT